MRIKRIQKDDALEVRPSIAMRDGAPLLCSGVTCPNCGGATSRVVDSRGGILSGCAITKRRRSCAKCEVKFTTYELSDNHLEAVLDEQSVRRVIGALHKMVVGAE